MAPPILGGGTPAQKIGAWVVAGGLFAAWKYYDNENEKRFNSKEATAINEAVMAKAKAKKAKE